jgi:integrase
VAILSLSFTSSLKWKVTGHLPRTSRSSALICKVEKISGVEFKLKDFRSTLTSITVNGDISRLPAMSALLRHASVATTQKSYFAMERGVAGKQLRDAWKEHPIASPIKHEKAVIDSNRYLPGYG